MSTTRMALAVVVATVTVCAAAAAGTNATKKHIAITITPGKVTTFALGLSSTDSVVRDSGKVAFDQESEFVVTRGGQRVRQWKGVASLTGTRGELSLRLRIDWLNAGRGYEAGVGTWTAVEGTGAYATLHGSGRSAHVWLPRGPVASRMDGYVTEG